jgi:hypothetical protein
MAYIELPEKSEGYPPHSLRTNQAFIEVTEPPTQNLLGMRLHLDRGKTFVEASDKFEKQLG